MTDFGTNLVESTVETSALDVCQKSLQLALEQRDQQVLLNIASVLIGVICGYFLYRAFIKD